jgi:hypothetical protein
MVDAKYAPFAGPVFIGLSFMMSGLSIDNRRSNNRSQASVAGALA